MLMVLVACASSAIAAEEPAFLGKLLIRSSPDSEVFLRKSTLLCW